MTTGLPANTSNTLQSQQIVTSDVTNYLDALEIDEVLYDELPYEMGVFGEFFGSLVVNFKDDRKKEPPAAFIFVVATISADDELLVPVPSYGFSDYDPVYGGFQVTDYTDASTSRTTENVVSQTLFSGTPINILGLILKNKATRQSVYDYTP